MDFWVKGMLTHMPNHRVPESARIGQHVVIEDDVVLGERVELGHFCVLLKGTTIGERCTIQTLASMPLIKAFGTA
ncbi:hypothetical protein [Paenibacillus sp. MBLB4367]|uniref:hypothetical protein n=1 Tax=Paenibacillus sp. MBLB4367 TaxID=3384767 RepID=UPI0039080C24